MSRRGLLALGEIEDGDAVADEMEATSRNRGLDAETVRIKRMDGGCVIESKNGETRWLPDQPPLVELGQGRHWDDDRGAWIAFLVLAAVGVVIAIGAVVLRCGWHP